jgi:hypothetical protein
MPQNKKLKMPQRQPQPDSKNKAKLTPQLCFSKLLAMLDQPGFDAPAYTRA